MLSDTYELQVGQSCMDMGSHITNVSFALPGPLPRIHVLKVYKKHWK